MQKSTVQLEELPYQPDTATLFARLRDLPGALLFDSSFPHSRQGRFDILTADPDVIAKVSLNNSAVYDDIFEYFQELGEVYNGYCKGLVTPSEDIPFCGGIAGALDYGIGKPLQHLPADDQARADLHFYHWAVIQDHLLGRCTLASLPSLPTDRRQQLLERLRSQGSPPQPAFALKGSFESNLDRQSYREAFLAIQRYILAGDCYQVNLARRFAARYRGEAWSAYLRLRQVAAAPFSGYMRCPDGREILCLSPERFLRLSGQHVETRPIKGTRPRYSDERSDALAAEALRSSAKDRAENLMIVDLLRNDISRNCLPGTVRVDRLFELESYPTVHHLVSTISGELLPGHSALDLLRDSFPGGSITGTPKRRAMQVIEELEPAPRSAYCGSLLYVSADGRMDSNIAIRTLVCEGESIHCWGGGGIVADSDWESEFQETWDKVGPLMAALESSS